MKIHFDKVIEKPLHALTPAEMRQVISFLPSEWLENVTEIRFSNALEQHWHLHCSYFGTMITVYARGRTKREAITSILTRLGARHLGIQETRGYSEAQLHRISQIIEPYIDQIVASFPRPKPNQTVYRTPLKEG